MSRLCLFLAGILLLAPLSPALTEEREELVTLELPAGDAAAGRAAFLALSCTSCHAVAGEKTFPKPVSANPGPTLGAYQAKLGTKQLGMSIVAPSHDITATVREHEDELSPMGDFSEAMTVRQLLDLIAFLRSLDR